MIHTWEEEMWQGREVREPSPAVVRVDADFTWYIWKISLRQGRISDRKSSFTNRNLFDLEWHLREKTLIFFPLMLLSQPFLGQDDDSQNLIASASHFWYNSTCSASYFLWLTLLSSSLISHCFHPTFSFKSPLASVFLLLLFQFPAPPLHSTFDSPFAKQNQEPQECPLQSHPLHFVNIC